MNKVIFCIGMCLCIYPLVNRGIEQFRQKNVIATYEQQVQSVERKELEEAVKKAEQYNRDMYQLKGILRQSPEDFPEEYEQLLNLFDNGIMGSISIPKINLNLPVYHGTGEEVLSVGAGHLPESSLPVGGASTHCILTGHRGLPGSRLFTRLDELELGDVFFLHIYNRTLAYRVCEIQVVKPENGEILEIQEGEDKVSLVTCTPYGINTHRLVITGRRTTYEKVDDKEKTMDMMSKRELVFTILPILCVGLAVVERLRRRRIYG